MLSEFDRGGVGCITGLREEDVEHQAAAGDQALGAELEDRTQLLPSSTALTGSSCSP